MAIQYVDFQEFSAAIGATVVSHTLSFWDDASGTINAARLTNAHSGLQSGGSFTQVIGGSSVTTSRIRLTVVSGNLVLEVNTSGLTDGTYWYVAGASTNGGSSWTDMANGGNVDIFTEAIETVTIGAGSTFTMTGDLPSSGKTTLVVNFGSSTSKLDGTASHFRIVNTSAHGKIQLNGPGICDRLGNGATLAHAIEMTPVGDAPLVCDQITFTNDGAVKYTAVGRAASDSSIVGDGYCTITSSDFATTGSMTINATAAGTDDFAVAIHGSGNRWYPSLFQSNTVEKSWLDISVNALDVLDNVFLGDRCGVVLADNTALKSFRRNIVDTRQNDDSTWSQVSGFAFTGSEARVLDWGENIFRGAEWQLRAIGGFTVADSVFADQMSHNMGNVRGHSTRDTIFERCITLPTTRVYTDTGTAPVNGVARFSIAGPNIKIRHCTHIGASGTNASHVPIVNIDEGNVLAEYKDNLAYQILVDRGPSIAGDACIAPGDASGFEQGISGTPLRPASTANRMAAANHNGFYGCGSNVADAYSDYGVGVTAGSLGTGDISTDPLFIDASAWTWPSDANIKARVSGASVTEMLALIRAKYTLGSSSPARSAASDGTHIGAVQLAAPLIASAVAQHRPQSLRPRIFAPGLAR